MENNYQIVLEDLETYLKPQVFSYLLTLFNDEPLERGNSSFSDDKLNSDSQQKGGTSLRDSLQSSLSSPNDLQDFIKKESTRSSHFLPSLSPSQQSLLSASCSDLLGQRKEKIRTKGGTLNGRSRKSRSRMLEVEEFKRNVLTPYDPLIGKINQSDPPLFERGRKLPKPTKGVREFSNPISNPLYKNYNPKGYVKNEDEIAREFINEITNDFNAWLRSFEGDLVQLDPDMMIKILRDDMELVFDDI